MKTLTILLLPLELAEDAAKKKVDRDAEEFEERKLVTFHPSKAFRLKVNPWLTKPCPNMKIRPQYMIILLLVFLTAFSGYQTIKLFGKIEGRFWIPPHVKGNKKEGIVEKDYLVTESK
jgi:hypothetical protein